ncbi:hypothetical protein Chor_017307 [Crotalus horridus]
MVAPKLFGNRRLWDSSASFFFLLQLLLSAVEAKQESVTADFDVRPGGMVHSYSQNLGDVACNFTYAAQGGTNEQWEMIIGVSDDKTLPQGKSYLFFTQFKAEMKGAKIKYAMAYVPGPKFQKNLPSSSPVAVDFCSPVSAARLPTGGPTASESHLPTLFFLFPVSHREGKFHSQLAKLMIVAEKSHDEL